MIWASIAGVITVAGAIVGFGVAGRSTQEITQALIAAALVPFLLLAGLGYLIGAGVAGAWVRLFGSNPWKSHIDEFLRKQRLS